MKYAVNDVYPAIQGEGCMTGTPMLLVRLHGCPVGCPFCDTKETWIADPAKQVDSIDEALGTNEAWAEVDAVTLAMYVSCQRRDHLFQWVLLTGGEPALQDLAPLVELLHLADLKVALETSGTAEGHLHTRIDWCCVSPKIAMPGKRVISPRAVKSAHEVKFVIGKEADLIAVESFLHRYPLRGGATVCLQPMSGSAKATALSTEACLARGWRLSIQTHKTIGLR